MKKMLHIRTPYGNHYLINARAEIVAVNRNLGTPILAPSGQWKLQGIEHVKHLYFIPFDQITPEKLASITLKYKNGHPQYTVRDLDHGSTRTWGNTHYHGISDIYFE